MDLGVWPLIAFMAACLYLSHLYLQRKFRIQDEENEVWRCKEEFKTLKRPLDYEDEIAVPIKTIWIHPIRGILAKPVKEAYICPYGMKYDRELALIDIETNSPLTSTSWIKAAFITQELIYEPKPLLRLTTSSPDLLKSRNLPISLDIYLTDDLPSINHRKYRNCERTYGGYEYPEDVNNWISTAIRKPVVLIHSRLTRLNLIRKQYAILKRENDQARCFCFDGALHMISEGSIRDLKSRVQKRYPDAPKDKFKVDMVNFRPNIAIDSDVPYIEDSMMEMRIGNCLIRNIGPTFRCNDVMTNYQQHRKNPENEPLSTLASYRTLPQRGVPFGIYSVMHVIDNPNVYNRLFPESYGYPPFTENEPVTIREADEQRYTRIKVGQEIRIRPTDKPKWIRELREQPQPQRQ